MKVFFREIGPDEVEQEMTQRDQFNTDEVGLAETLMREPHQNSMDASEAGNVVRTRIAISETAPEFQAYWKEMFEPLRPHLEACGIDLTGIDLSRPRILVIEDFGTSGLTGAWDKKDDGNFSDFWRRVGRSHKGGTKGGRWGLGKLVYSSSSQIGSFFGISVAVDDTSGAPTLMGQAVLNIHRIGSKDFVPHGFFAETGPGGIPLPVRDPTQVEAFRRASGISRTKESGLSIAVPFIRDGFTESAFIPFVVKNYFFPILTGQLEVTVGSETITAGTFDELARKYGGPELADGQLVRFIREIDAARKTPPKVTLSSTWTKNMETALDEETLKELRDAYSGKKLVHVRAPISLRPKSGPVEATHLDLFLRLADEGVAGRALAVRGGLTIPGESQSFFAGQVFGALVAQDKPITSFLGDAENPAHTRWTGTAGKLTERWRNPAPRLQEIRRSLNGLHAVLARAIERLENDALIHLLSVKEAGQKKPVKHDVIRPPIVPPIQSKPKPYSIASRVGGFAVKGAPTPAVSFPMQIRVRAAYDILRGNPFKKHSPYDFDMMKTDLQYDCSGATYSAISPNELVIEATDPDFSVEVKGFDPRRDLLVRATD
ncbi:MAG: hypothetical protein WD823_12695 [Sulfuricaulis sp.]|uniref:hypothetical protein n=1 Tax=Sulfuricaulis sp. TaxID=2003553 RepID=UPI0034A39481